MNHLARRPALPAYDMLSYRWSLPAVLATSCATVLAALLWLSVFSCDHDGQCGQTVPGVMRGIEKISIVVALICWAWWAAVAAYRHRQWRAVDRYDREMHARARAHAHLAEARELAARYELPWPDAEAKP